MHFVFTDNLGSYSLITDQDGAFEERMSYDAWGRRRNPTTWTYYATGTEPAHLFDRGFTGHEHLDNFAIINMNGRLYDPVLGRMLSPDNYVQDATGTQSFNRYAYCLNNPLKYTDPTGDFFWMPVIIGAVMGGYSGWQIGKAHEATGLSMARYIAGGAAIGGLSGYLGGAVAASGMPFANTAAIAAGSYTSSVGTHILSGGQTPVSVSFGFGSYNFDSGEFGYVGKKGNSFMENVGYGLGSLANLADVNQVINSTKATLYTDNSDFISHNAIVDKNTGDPLMSFGPNDTKVPNTKLGYASYFRKSTSDFHYNPTLPVDITVNKYTIDVVRGLGKVLPFQGITTNCVNMASLSLWLNGIPNIGLQPYLLYATTWAYTAGIRPDLFSYYFTQYGR